MTEAVPRLSRVARFESRFISPVRQRLDRFRSRPSETNSPTPNNPPVGDYVRYHRRGLEEKERRNMPYSNRTSGILDVGETRQHRRGRPLSNGGGGRGDEGRPSPDLDEMRARLNRLRR